MKWFSNNQSKPYLLLLPSLAVIFILVFYGLIVAVLESLKTPASNYLLTFYNYKQLFSNRLFLDSFIYSIKISLISTFLSLLIGIILTKLLDTHLLKEKWDILIWIPMVVPHFVAGYMIFLFFSPTGWFSGLWYHLNWLTDPSQFPILVNDREGVGIILTYVWKEVPFVILMLLPVFHQLNPQYKDVVRTLGGGPWQVFITAEWPWLFPVVMETGIILFAFILSAFEVPYLLGVTYPKMISILVYQWFFEGNWSHRPLAMAAILYTSFVIILLTLVYFCLSQNARLRNMKGR